MKGLFGGGEADDARGAQRAARQARRAAARRWWRTGWTPATQPGRGRPGRGLHQPLHHRSPIRRVLLGRGGQLLASGPQRGTAGGHAARGRGNGPQPARRPAQSLRRDAAAAPGGLGNGHHRAHRRGPRRGRPQWIPSWRRYGRHVGRSLRRSVRRWHDPTRPVPAATPDTVKVRAGSARTTCSAGCWVVCLAAA